MYERLVHSDTPIAESVSIPNVSLGKDAKFSNKFKRPLQATLRGILAANLFMASDGHSSASTEILTNPIFASQNGQEIDQIPEFTAPERDQKAIVILLRNNDRPEPFTVEYAESQFQEVDEFMAENSYGKIDYDFTVTDWYAAPQQIECQNLDGLAELGDEALQSFGIDGSQYNTRIYIVDAEDDIGCTIGGHGQKTEPYNRVWIYSNFQEIEPHTVEHELGHSLGLPHTLQTYCHTLNDFTNNCGSIENSPVSNDTMGSKSVVGFSAPNRVALGWVTEDQIQTITEDGIYEINPLETDEGDTKVIRIKKPDTNEYYYIELRNPEVEYEYHGAIIRIWNEEVGSPARTIGLEGVGRGLDQSGEGLYDAVNGIRITLGNVENEEAQVIVEFEN